jgi:hypothetical protein
MKMADKQSILLATVLPLLLMFSTCSVKAQPVPPPGPLAELYNSIKAQESNFPLPNTDQTITVGTLDLTMARAEPFTPAIRPKLKYAVPVYEDGTFYIQSAPIPLSEQADHRSTIWHQQVKNQGGLITIANIRHLNIKFFISNWSFVPDGGSVSFQLGSSDTPVTVKKGTQEVIFNNVSLTNPAISIAVNGISFVNGHSKPYKVEGLLAIKIDWKLVGAGIITIPVLPINIVYAPVADSQKKNQAATATSLTSGNVSTFSFSNQNSTSLPIPSSFQTSVDMSKDMSVLGSALSKIPNPYTQAIGAALNTVSGMLGTSTASQTNSMGVTEQHSLAVSSTNSQSQIAMSSAGGPGTGDIILYNYNARVAWYSLNGEMRLAVIGSDGTVQATAGQLKAARKQLIDQHSGKRHPIYFADTAALTTLIHLDPLATLGPTAALLPPRFIDISHGVVHVTGGVSNVSYNYQLSNTDLHTTFTTKMQTETDNAGFLSFLGWGVTTSGTFQTQITQGSSSQTSTSKNFSANYVFNGNGNNENYATEVYFDVVFGAFAFRDVSSAVRSKKLMPTISGIVMQKDRRPKFNQKLNFISGNHTCTTTSDKNGKFSLYLPELKLGLITLVTGSTTQQFQYTGSAIENVQVQP